MFIYIYYIYNYIYILYIRYIIYIYVIIYIILYIFPNMVDDHRTLSHNIDENPIIYLIYPIMWWIVDDPIMVIRLGIYHISVGC
jgi:hypothetical protein